MSQHDKAYEKLGVFYLGRTVERATGQTSPTPLLYDSKDLTTHGMVVGMTGSGKTGLCVSLLEDAGIDGIPALVIDPKGDIANLLLTFPNLSVEDFEPWVEPAEAVRQGLGVDEFAKLEAKKWREGLAKWDQEPERIQMFRDAVEIELYTPGSNTARSLSLLREFTPPPAAILEDFDLLQDRIASAVSGLLGLMRIDADPVRSREHILLSKLLEQAWTAGKGLTLAQLIGQLQNPPLTHVGIMDLESFFPAKDRTDLAMTINNLLASPTFAGWMSGEPLEIGKLLYTATGKPKVSILSIAHLSDSQRMFFVTLLLNEVIAWMRTQSGTSSLRAILYMDEVFGYFPPLSNPPSKGPMLTLLKQARAYGLGVLLATQNPVDLDYKGLSNIGTWFLGRLQTERDKQRILDGLEGASTATGSSFSRSEMETTLSGLGARRFVMNNVHDREPTLFETRWAMSYLRGPLSRDQLKTLAQGLVGSRTDSPAPVVTATPGSVAAAVVTPARVANSSGANAPQVVLPAGIVAKYLLPDRSLPSGQKLVYCPGILATGRMHFVSAAQKVDSWEERTFLVKLPAPLPADLWTDVETVSDVQFEDQGLSTELAPLPPEASSMKNFELWNKQFLSFLYREQVLTLHSCAPLKAVSQPGESEREFRIRLRQGLLERRDLQTEQLRKKFATKFSSLEGKIQRAKEKIEAEQSRQSQRKWDTALTMGTTILGALMGKKAISATTVGRTASTIKKAGQTVAGQTKMKHAEDSLEGLLEAKQELEAEFQQAVDEIESEWNADEIPLVSTEVKPRKSDLAVLKHQFVWLPYAVDRAGIAVALYSSEREKGRAHGGS
ncbi:MAG: ATP-binding protein [Planctomycetaceae bacterium]|nr:ATP-binding protein [Planctomycetaceae bacterium]